MQYRCFKCGFTDDIKRPLARCPICGGNMRILYDADEVGFKPDDKLPGIWKYTCMIKLPLTEAYSLGEGRTPLIRSFRLSRKFGVEKLYIKDETRNPTGSFIDRGSTVLVSMLKHFGYKRVFCEAKGNLAASLSAYSSLSGIKCYVKIRGHIDRGKLYQILLYGGEILSDERKIAPYYSVYPADPFLIEGYKTLSFEIYEDLEFKVPDSIVVPVGNGCLIYSIWKGFYELRELNVIDDFPRLYGVQEDVCAPLAYRFQNIDRRECRKGIAVEINERRPYMGDEAIKVSRDTGGRIVSVGSMDIIEALRDLARYEGILVEPAGAAAFSAFKKLLEEGEIDSKDTVVVLATGAGLKNPRSLVKALSSLERSVMIGGTKKLILEILSRKPQHVYSLWKSLRERGLNISKTAVYLHVRELERLGYVVSEYVGRRKILKVSGKITCMRETED